MTPFNGLGRAPNLPDPTKIANSGVSSVKAIVNGGLDAGADVVAGAEQILFNVVSGSIDVVEDGASSLVRMAQRSIDEGRTTVGKVRSDVARACDTVLSQVDQAVGGEIVRKFKSEVDRLLT